MELYTVLHRIVFLDTSNLTARSGTGISNIIIQLLYKLLRTVTTYRIEKFCVDFKIINNFHIHIHISLPDVLTVNCLRLVESIITLHLPKCYSQISD